MNQISKISLELSAACGLIDRLQKEIDAHHTDDPADDFVDQRTVLIGDAMLWLGSAPIYSPGDAVEMLDKLDRHIDIYKNSVEIPKEDRIILGIVRSVRHWIDKNRGKFVKSDE